MTKFSSFFSEADVEKMTHTGPASVGVELAMRSGGMSSNCRSEQVPLTSTTNLLCPLGDERPAFHLEPSLPESIGQPVEHRTAIAKKNVTSRAKPFDRLDQLLIID